MLWGTVGNPRTGKTLIDVREVVRILIQNQTIKPYANMPYRNPNFPPNQFTDRVRYITPKTLMQLRLPHEHDGLVQLDELWKWLQARMSGFKEINQVLGVMIFEHGKRGFDIKWDSQLSSSIDKWVRILTPKFYYTKTPSRLAFRFGYVSDSYHGGKKVIHMKLSKANAEKYYPLFPTMFSPEFATEDNTPTMKDIQSGNLNELNDLSGITATLEDTPERFIPSDIDNLTNQKDMNMIKEQIEERERAMREKLGQLSLDMFVNEKHIEEQMTEIKMDLGLT
jgi:hypothetical protein